MRFLHEQRMPLGKAVVALAVICGVASSQSALTTIQDTLFRADGTRFSGTLTIQWSTFDAANIGTIVQQSKSVAVANGNLQVQLMPNAGAPSPANVYTVLYQSDGRQQFMETWTVPSSATPLKLGAVRVGTITSSGNGAVGGQTPIVETAVVGLVADLNQRPIKGPGYGTGSVAVINQDGQIETAVGNLGDCVLVDGTTGPCGGPASTFYDAETPGGVVDGSNATFTLGNAPSGTSLELFRNGLYMKAGSDYTLTGSTVQFAASSIPQSMDVLIASYRVDAGSGSAGALQHGGGSGGGAQGPQGPAGPAGPAGPQGPQGPAGVTGPMGPSGAQGLIGPTGPQGLTGLTGAAGAAGAQGPIGPTGPQGLTGLTGLTGAAGAAGPAGPQGLTGSAGPAGAQGPVGLTGPQGLTGAPGAAGLSGGWCNMGNIGATPVFDGASCVYGITPSTLTGIAVSGNVATATFAVAPPQVAAGTMITVSGSATGALNATYPVTSVAGATVTFSTSAVANGTYNNGGLSLSIPGVYTAHQAMLTTNVTSSAAPNLPPGVPNYYKLIQNASTLYTFNNPTNWINAPAIPPVPGDYVSFFGNVDGTNNFTYTAGSSNTGFGYGPAGSTCIAPATGYCHTFDPTNLRIQTLNQSGATFGEVKDAAAQAGQVIDSIVNGVPHQRALIAGDIPNNAANTTGSAGSTTGNAATATQLAAAPALCGAGQSPTGILANGNATGCQATGGGGGSGGSITVANAAVTGTKANGLAKLTGAPSAAVSAAVSDTGGIVGIVTAGAGTTGSATITTSGLVNCIFDNATTAGDYVQISSTAGGDCHDSGAGSYPASNQVLGRVLSTNAAAGTYQIDLFPSEVRAFATGGSGTVLSVTLTGDGILDSATPSSAVTTSGTVTATPIQQPKNLVLAGPASGAAANPAFRALVAADEAPLVLNAPTVGSADTLSCPSTAGITTGYVNFAGQPALPAFTQTPGAAYAAYFVIQLTTGATPATMGFQLAEDGTTLFTPATALAGPGTNISGAEYILSFMIESPAVGAGGTLHTQNTTPGFVSAANANNITLPVTPVDTTSNHTLKLGMKCGSANSGSYTLVQSWVEKKY